MRAQFFAGFAITVLSSLSMEARSQDFLKSREIPATLKGKGDLLEIPAGYAVKWQGVVLAQTPNIVRELTIVQYDRSGSAVNSKTIHYDDPNQTGIDCGKKAGCEFPVLARPTWIATTYSLGRTTVTTTPGAVTTRLEIYGQREAYIKIAYARSPKELPDIRLP